MSFTNSGLSKKAPGSRSYIFKDNKIISFADMFQQYIKNFSEWEIIEFLSPYFSEKCSNGCKIRKSALLEQSCY